MNNKMINTEGCRGRSLVVLGAGESGVGAAILGKDLGMDVFVSDFGTIPPARKAELDAEGIAWEEGGHSMERLLAADEVVKSPGIPQTAPAIVAVRAKGIPVVSEIELAGRFTDSRMVCITGSNGKTTTTTLIHHILRTAGLDASVAGNIGHSLAWQVAREPHDVYVVELSSFQLEDMHRFKANVAVLLNITPDHMDRYDHSLNLYADAKMRIVRNQTPDDAFIYWHDDPVLAQAILRNGAAAGARLTFGEQPRPGQARGAWLRQAAGEEEIVFSTDRLSLAMPRAQLSLSGLHNLYNSMAAGLSACLVPGVERDAVVKALSDFEGVEHRLEYVATVDGVRYINDSKATNVNSAWYALESMPASKTTVLILGGKDKGNDYSELQPLVDRKVKAIVCLGADNAKLLDFYGSQPIPVRSTASVDECLAACRELASEGDTVLLSPCCASFDLFKSYEHRGQLFKQAVHALKPKKQPVTEKI